MNDELVNIVMADLKAYNKETGRNKCRESEEEQVLVEARLEELFPGYNLKVVLNPKSSFFKWYQSDLGVELAIARVVHNPDLRTDIVGKAHGASRTIAINRPADFYACRGFVKTFTPPRLDNVR